MIDKDAFSNGQIGSKIWLCQEIENLFDRVETIWIYGGWYGMSAFLLRSRANTLIKRIYSYDLDPECQEVADMINENWVCQEWQFKAFTEDCNKLFPRKADPDLIINTSTEHFETMEWWDNIPEGTTVAIQGNDMEHDDHVVHSNSLDDFCQKYPVSEVLYRGSKKFIYPDWNFTRFMLIGIK